MTADIAIVGAGIAGLSLAALLEKNGFNYTIYERLPEDAPLHGGCLDLHPYSGQKVFKQIGLFEEFKRHTHGGDSTIHYAYDKTGDLFHSWGDGRNAPEIDRPEIRRVLMMGIPKGKIQWSHELQSAARDSNGQVVLSFRNGTTATGFRLVVGADGLKSKIRHLVHPVKPAYTGQIFLSTKVTASNPMYPTLEEMARRGAMAVVGNSVHIFTIRQGDGHYDFEIGIQEPEDFGSRIDLSDDKAVKKFLLQDSYFGAYAQVFQDIIKHGEGGFHPWFLYYMPPECFNWKTSPGVTIIGDAAHVTPPHIGEGANNAMLDAIILKDKMKEFGITDKAVMEYEKEMFPLAADLITRSLASGEMWFEPEAPKSFLASMTSANPHIGDPDFLGAKYHSEYTSS